MKYFAEAGPTGVDFSTLRPILQPAIMFCDDGCGVAAISVCGSGRCRVIVVERRAISKAQCTSWGWTLLKRSIIPCIID